LHHRHAAREKHQPLAQVRKDYGESLGDRRRMLLGRVSTEDQRGIGSAETE
jgi:hypothetical protein